MLNRSRTAVFLLAAVTLVAGLVAGRRVTAEDQNTKEKQETTPTDKELIQGTWKLVEFIKNGEVVTPTDSRDVSTWTFDGDRCTMLSLRHKGGDKELDRTPALSFRLDSSRKPKTLDIEYPPNKKGKVVERYLYVYRLEGDTLKMCGHSGGERPNDFEAAEGRYLFTLKRTSRQNPDPD